MNEEEKQGDYRCVWVCLCALVRYAAADSKWNTVELMFAHPKMIEHLVKRDSQ